MNDDFLVSMLRRNFCACTYLYLIVQSGAVSQQGAMMGSQAAFGQASGASSMSGHSQGFAAMGGRSMGAGIQVRPIFSSGL